jgi:uncharacterized alkaline shock family protein YloU
MDATLKSGSSEDKIKISEDVIATIAGIAASEVDNLASMSGGFVDGIAGMLGKKNLSKGIKVDVKENDVTIELSLTMQYGCKIHEVARCIQEKVRITVQDMTGMNVIAVNINVLGITMDNREAKNSERPEELPPSQA